MHSANNNQFQVLLILPFIKSNEICKQTKGQQENKNHIQHNTQMKREMKNIARKYHSTQFVQEQILIIVDGQRGNCFTVLHFYYFRIYLHHSPLLPGRIIFNNFSLRRLVQCVHTHTH